MPHAMAPIQEQLINRLVENGCPKDEAPRLAQWGLDTPELFALWISKRRARRKPARTEQGRLGKVAQGAGM